MFEFFQKKKLSFPNFPDPVPSDEMPAPPYQRISDIRKVTPETMEQELRQCFFEHSLHTGAPLLPGEVITQIIARIKLNLSAEHLLFGVNEILNHHNIKLQNSELFENFIITCKIFYEVRQTYFMFSTSHEMLNQLDLETKKNLVVFHNMLRSALNQEVFSFENVRAINVPEEDLCLRTLKINPLSYGTERILKVFGLENCYAMSEMGMKKFLTINVKNKELVMKKLDKSDDHVFLIFASNITFDVDNKPCYQNGLALDIWSGKIYPVEKMSELLCARSWDEEHFNNVIKSVDPSKISSEIDSSVNNVTSWDPSYYQNAITSYTKLQQAAQAAINAIDRYVKPEDKYKDISAFLELKRKDLIDFIHDVQFAIENIKTDDENITMIDRLNDQIENFYTTLFCKIWRIPHQNERFFDKSQFVEMTQYFFDQNITRLRSPIFFDMPVSSPLIPPTIQVVIK